VFRFDVLPDVFNLIHFANVAGIGFGAAPSFADATGNRLATVNLAAADNHMGAVVCQGAGDALADATAGAGDKQGFAFEVGGGHGALPGLAPSSERELLVSGRA
jgi:hypothetical protein